MAPSTGSYPAFWQIGVSHVVKRLALPHQQFHFPCIYMLSRVQWTEMFLVAFHHACGEATGFKFGIMDCTNYLILNRNWIYQSAREFLDAAGPLATPGLHSHCLR